MTFQPIVPTGGLSGWAFLNRTMDSQKAAHDTSAVLARDVAYFKENIGNVSTAGELVSDYRLLKVALGAFGLDDDIGNKFFIEKILSEGTLETDTLANRMTDTRYKKMSAAFGFGDFDVPLSQVSSFADNIAEAYKTRSFEVAVGNQNDSFRLAMNLERELSDLADDGSSEETKWFSILGSEPMRAVFETAFGLPDAFGALDIDKQLETFSEKATKAFGSGDVSQFTDPAKREELIRLFLVRTEIQGITPGLSSAQTALTLLQAG